MPTDKNVSEQIQRILREDWPARGIYAGGREIPDDPFILQDNNIITTLVDWGIKIILLFIAYMVLSNFILGALALAISTLNQYAFVIVFCSVALLFAIVSASQAPRRRG